MTRLTSSKLTKISLLLVTATGVSAAAYSGELPTHFSDDVTAPFSAVARSSYTIFTIASTVFDYKYSLRGLAKDSDVYRETIAEVHLRSARKSLKLCEVNKGFYVKAGQFAASLRQIPKEYMATLSVLQDQAVPCDFRLIKEVIRRNLGKDCTDIFLSFDEQPIAAASIAQVHRAVLKNHEEVAVKVQYPGLERLMELDMTTMTFVSKFVAWLFPEYRFGWILSGFKESISAELDFVQEARNSERTANNFMSSKNVKIPPVFWDLTTKQVLTMQFCSGHKVDDLESLKKSGIDANKVAKALVEVFAEMIFVHGFVHGDPHPGNILVSLNGPKGFSLVLLDHGMYKELNEGFRKKYCLLWKAMILQNVNEIEHVGEYFGISSYARYLPLIFTGRLINSKTTLGKEMTVEERKNVREELKVLTMGDISSFMECLPPDLLTILRTDGILRSILSKLGTSSTVRLLTYAKYAVHGLSVKQDTKSGSILDRFISDIRSRLSYLQLKCLLGLIGLLSLINDIKDLYRKSFRRLIVVC
ncbi:uncharacterized protein LOC141622429 [Silene latifolia]|uniref:uncharacterized protein LOC141622429 n=1 Tax=Silene latifolia TaxID=37657 RepID=UPI003D76B0B7